MALSIRTYKEKLKKDAVGKRYVYTNYNKEDMSKLEDFLLYPITTGEAINLADGLEAFKQGLADVATKASVSTFTGYFHYQSKNRGKSLVQFRTNLPYESSKLKASLKVSEGYITKYLQDVNAAIKNGTLAETKDALAYRAKLISQCETARTTNTIATATAEEAGAEYWYWGQTSSDEPREDHEVLVGERSLLGETPSPDGSFPGEEPNCKCTMIFEIPNKNNLPESQEDLFA